MFLSHHHFLKMCREFSWLQTFIYRSVLISVFFLRRKKGPQKAEVYLQGALKTYLAEGWALLVTHTRKQLAECQKHLGQIEKYPLKGGARKIKTGEKDISDYFTDISLTFI